MNQTAFQFQKRRIDTVALGDWLKKARTQISAASEEPASSINALIGFVLNKPVHFGISHPETSLSAAEETCLNGLLDRLLSGEPLAYLIGRQEFFGIDFKVTPDVLIPRPETELLVEKAVDWLQTRRGKVLVADVGTGSGCIAAAICSQIPSAKVVGTDFSYNALQIAKKNIQSLELENRISLVQSDLMAGLQGQFDCICANLPYIPSEILSSLRVKKFEPLAALDGGLDGLKYFGPLLYQSQTRLKPDGQVLLEIETTRSQAVIELAALVFPSASIRIHHDLAGLPRLVQIQLIAE